MDNLGLPIIEDYLMNTCVVHSEISFEDALCLLSIELAKIANSTIAYAEARSRVW